MREAYAHDAALAMAADADTRAPGAAVTQELCGHWEHEPPCPLAPHHTAAERRGGGVRLRIVFVTDPAREEEVRRRIGRALERGRLDGPAGTVRWRLLTTAPGVLAAGERQHASSLMEG
ncbi:hypothetical protein [Georgenia sp. AZ-5]|uniref:hypothetical protein n=1 Tax=Georgenia sp. AZ-5 TaxID=3367526 RepID=UPI003753F84B